MSDLISRQAAIDAILDLTDFASVIELFEYVEEHDLQDKRSGGIIDAIDAVLLLPSAQPERLTDDDFETIRIHLSAYKEKLCNQRRWKEAEEYQRIIDRFMKFASAQPEQRWIPCSEKMPDKEGRYLCAVGATFHNPRVMTYAPDAFLKGDCDTWRAEDGAYCFNWFVEAWMPLPDPYKGDEQDE